MSTTETLEDWVKMIDPMEKTGYTAIEHLLADSTVDIASFQRSWAKVENELPLFREGTFYKSWEDESRRKKCQGMCNEVSGEKDGIVHTVWSDDSVSVASYVNGIPHGLYRHMEEEILFKDGEVVSEYEPSKLIPENAELIVCLVDESSVMEGDKQLVAAAKVRELHK